MTVRTNSFKEREAKNVQKSNDGEKNRKNMIKLRNNEPSKLILQPSLSFKDLVQDTRKPDRSLRTPTTAPLPEPALMFSPRPVVELDAAAVQVQKFYKSYRTRRNLADCAVVAEELWWKTLDSAALKQSSVSFFDVEKPETAVSRWARARTRAAKVGKGLSKDEKAQKLGLQHWLEAIDPRHRYGHNLHFYYDIWFQSQSAQPFFYWLDVGDGRELSVNKCSRFNLNRQCITYLAPKERKPYEVIVEYGKLLYKQSGDFVDTIEGSKWIFVLSTSRILYVGQKKKGVFQHSSFLSGAAITAAGRLVAHGGILEAIWPYSGHYHPTEENFQEFISFLEENGVDLSNVKKCSIDDDWPLHKVASQESCDSGSVDLSVPKKLGARNSFKGMEEAPITKDQNDEQTDEMGMYRPELKMSKRQSWKWSTGTGPRISCVRDYPSELQFRALEQVNLSPRLPKTPSNTYGPIPSPRPSPRIHLSPRIAYMGLPSPRTPIAAAN